MDLISNPEQTKIVVATSHVAKDGSPKIVQECSLPLTGANVVSTIITDLVSANSRIDRAVIDDDRSVFSRSTGPLESSL